MKLVTSKALLLILLHLNKIFLRIRELKYSRNKKVGFCFLKFFPNIAYHLYALISFIFLSGLFCIFVQE